MNDDASPVIDPTITLETLLAIPARESKTERFVDAAVRATQT